MNGNRITLAAKTAQAILDEKATIRAREAEVIRYLNGASASQMELAEALGISPQYFSDILRRRRGVSDEFLKAVIKVANKIKKSHD